MQGILGQNLFVIIKFAPKVLLYRFMYVGMQYLSFFKTENEVY